MDILDNEAKLFFKTYKRLPLLIERGEGCYLFANDGTKYLDMFSGLAVNALGYAHPGVIAAIEKQARKYTHLSNYFVQEPQVELAECSPSAFEVSKDFLHKFGNRGDGGGDQTRPEVGNDKQ